MVAGLLVAGVGRSGTSIATRLAVGCGLRPPAGADLMAGNHANPGGYWESVALAEENDRLLARWAATWWTPPAIVTAAHHAQLADRRVPARARFDEVFGPDPGWVWKDPRLTALLPFWTGVLPDAVVLAPVREPGAVARSIVARDGLDLRSALALVERHTRLLLQALDGQRVLVADHARLCTDPRGWVDELVAFGRGHGLALGAPPGDELADLVRAGAAPAIEAPIPPEHRELHEVVRHLIGAHDRFVTPPLPPVSATGAGLLDAIELPTWYVPATPDPVTSDPVTSDPVTSDPVTSDPVTSDPVTSDPVTPGPNRVLEPPNGPPVH